VVDANAQKPVGQRLPRAHFQPRERLAGLEMPPVPDETLKLLRGNGERFELRNLVLSSLHCTASPVHLSHRRHFLQSQLCRTAPCRQ
jgi:hypothetical protein